jgi:glycosyltransferase involved in cell wall biosynthesis
MDNLDKPLSFIVLSKEAWANSRRARKQLLFEALLRLPAVRELLYVDPPGHFGRSYVRQVPDSPMIRICERAYVLKGERFPFIRWINRLMVYLSITKYLKPGIRWFTFLYNPWDISLAKLLSRHGPVIFDWTEDWGAYYHDAILGAQQSAAINTSSAVIAVTEHLADRAKELSNRHKKILVLPNATAWKPEEDLQCPDDMRDIPLPRLGYVGSLGPWFDKGLVLDLAKAHPDWHWVLIGQADDDIKHALQRSANVHLLGNRPFYKLQSYMSQCQVLVAPYQKGVEGDATKLYDYLTLGLPIVSSKMTTAQRLQPYVRIASDRKSWLTLLEEALEEDDASLRKAQQQASLNHTWDVRASSLLDWLKGFKDF